MAPPPSREAPPGSRRDRRSSGRAEAVTGQREVRQRGPGVGGRDVGVDVRVDALVVELAFSFPAEDVNLVLRAPRPRRPPRGVEARPSAARSPGSAGSNTMMSARSPGSCRCARPTIRACRRSRRPRSARAAPAWWEAPPSCRRRRRRRTHVDGVEVAAPAAEEVDLSPMMATHPAARPVPPAASSPRPSDCGRGRRFRRLVASWFPAPAGNTVHDVDPLAHHADVGALQRRRDSRDAAPQLGRRVLGVDARRRGSSRSRR